jgi:hypothetical protein
MSSLAIRLEILHHARRSSFCFFRTDSGVATGVITMLGVSWIGGATGTTTGLGVLTVGVAMVEGAKSEIGVCVTGWLTGTLSAATQVKPHLLDSTILKTACGDKMCKLKIRSEICFFHLETYVFSQDVHVVVAILAEAKNDLKGSACFRRTCSALHADLVHVPDVGSFSNFLALHKNAKIISEKISALQARVHRCAVHVTTDDASRIDESSVVSHSRTNMIRNLRLVSATNFIAFITRPTIVTTLSNNVDFFYHLNHCINKKSTSTHFGCGHIVAI